MSYSQQLPLFTQYTEYGALINPGSLPIQSINQGLYKSVGVSYRDQWIQLPDRPRTMAIRAEKFIPKSKGTELIIGGFLLHDKIGIFSTTELKTRIATTFRLAKNRKRHLTVGLNLGIGIYRADLTKIPYVGEDPNLFRAKPNIVSPDLGIGFSFHNTFANEDIFIVGLAMPQLFGLDRTFTNSDKTFDLTAVPHFYLTTSYFKYFSRDTYIEFSGWLKQVKNVPLNLDLNVRYMFTANLWLGAGINTGGIIHTEVGVVLQTSAENYVKVGYSFNPTFSDHSVLFGTTHELNLNYNF